MEGQSDADDRISIYVRSCTFTSVYVRFEFDSGVLGISGVWRFIDTVSTAILLSKKAVSRLSPHAR